MKTFKQYTESCWKGYEAIGVKKKNGKTVPNCVPVKEDGAAAMGSAGPTNAVSSGAIAGSGGLGGEPGVSKKKKPIMAPTFRRKNPQ